MANTTRFNIEIPDTGADSDIWGNILNAYLNSLEQLVTDKRGDTVTGDLKVTTYNTLAQTVSVTGTTTLNLATANYFQGTATAAATFVFSNPAASGRAHDFVLELTNGGNFTITWPASAKWPNGLAPTLTTNGVDFLVFVTDDGGLNWRGNLVMKDSK
jgi:hypothetical protein